MNNNDKIWTNTITKFKELNNNIDPDEIDNWLNKLYILSIKNTTITLIAPNKFVQKHIKENYLKSINDIFNDTFSNQLEVKLVLKNNIVEKEISSDNKINKIKEDEVTTKNDDIIGINLNKEYTFENFVVGNSNEFATAACLSISEKFDKNRNPIYIYGDVGLGKTHLMQAVGNRVKQNNPRINVLYITGSLFMKQFISDLRSGKADETFDKFNKIDLFLFDDVEFIAGKDATMKQFFQIYELLYSNNKQILITSNSLPSDINEMDPRLASRFNGGLTVEISNPSVEEKIAIITKYLNLHNNPVKFNDTIIHYIAENIKTKSTRELIGLLTSIIAKYELSNGNIKLDIDYISKEFKDKFYNKNKLLNSDEILNEVANFFNIKISDIKSKSRSKNITLPRNIAMYIIYNNTKSSLDYIGKIFNRDHSTVLNSINKIKATLEEDEGFNKKIIDNIMDKLKG